MTKTSTKKNETTNPVLEDDDYYFENGLMVLTSKYLLKRGYCCSNGCRHCPYENYPEPGSK